MRRLRAIARFLSYTYPALLLTPFFEEVALTVNAASPGSPYWFESYLIAADRWLFGGRRRSCSRRPGPRARRADARLLLRYYPLITVGIVLAWRGARRGTPAPGFHTALTCMMLGFFLSFIWYPFLPARGPWEHPGSCRPAAIRGLGVHARDRGDHRRRRGLGRMLPERARVGHVGADVWLVSAPPRAALVRHAGAWTQRRLRLHPVPPWGRCAFAGLAVAVVAHPWGGALAG